MKLYTIKDLVTMGFSFKVYYNFDELGMIGKSYFQFVLQSIQYIIFISINIFSSFLELFYIPFSFPFILF